MDVRRRRHTARLRTILPSSPPWEAWLQRSREWAPDFDALPSRPGLWPVDPARADSVRERWQAWLIGEWPAPPPDLEIERDATRLEVRFGGGRSRIRARLLLPAANPRPLPLFLTQTTHEWWAGAAVRRGMAACIVSAADGDDDTDTFPPSDTARLARRGWALCRVLDAVERAVPEVDLRRVTLAGHSRNGKSALIAAAFDGRFESVVASSAGVLGTVPARRCRDRHFGEGLELLTRFYPSWYHPRVRFFAGREDRLPTDAHELLGCIAPRRLLLGVAVNDQVESTSAVEETVAAIAHAFPASALAVDWREGGHGIDLEGMERYLDWVTGQGAPQVRAALHPGGRPAWDEEEQPRVEPEPPRAPRGAPVHGREPVHVAALLGRADPPADLEKRQGVSAEGVYFDVFARRPRGRTRRVRRPLALWLPPLSRAHGYVAGYEQATPMPVLLARAGYAAACFDLIGTGARIHEETAFARRHPHWTLLGRSLRDADQVLDAAAALGGVAADDTTLVGYGVGARIALGLAARREEVRAVVALSPPDLRAEELLAVPRDQRVLVITPGWEARDDLAAVLAALAHPGLEHVVVDDYDRLAAGTRDLVVAWLRRQAV